MKVAHQLRTPCLVGTSLQQQVSRKGPKIERVKIPKNKRNKSDMDCVNADERDVLFFLTLPGDTIALRRMWGW